MTFQVRLVAWAFDCLLRKQEAVQVRAFGEKPAERTREQIVEAVRDNVLAATDELHEVLHETGWKKWKRADYGYVNRARYIDELADVILFVLNLLLAQRVSGREITVALMKKWRANERRQQKGY